MPDRRPNLATLLNDAEVDHQVDLLRYSEGVREKVEANLEELGLEMEAALLAGGLTARATRRTEVLLHQVYKTIDTAYRKNAKLLGSELAELAKVEYASAITRLNDVIGAELFSTAMHPAELRELASKTMIRGAPQRAWWDAQKKSTQQRFASEVRLGVLQGESTDQIVQRIRGRDTGQRRVLTVAGKKRVVAVRSGGVIPVSKSQAESLVRTSIHTVSGRVLAETYKENQDVLKGTSHCSTLDLRTSDVCKKFDGCAWDFKGNPLPESKLKVKDPGNPPLHWRCRSVRVPITKSWDELAGKRGLQDLPPSTRASMDGQLPQDTTYDAWLKRQSKERQVEVLGTARQRLWSKGKVDLAGMVDTAGRSLSVEQLEAKAKRRR